MTDQQILGRILADLEWLKDQARKAEEHRIRQTREIVEIKARQVPPDEIHDTIVRSAVERALREHVRAGGVATRGWLALVLTGMSLAGAALSTVLQMWLGVGG